MAAESEAVKAEQNPIPKLQIYAPANSGVTPFWREKYEKDAKKYWDIFYKRHQDRFFKDRHYLDKEWGCYIRGKGRKVILEVGCGAGNTIFPLVASYSDIFIHACDFSPRAIDLVKAHRDFKDDQINTFVCDLTVDELSQQISPYSVDIVTMIFVLSAISPEKMHLVLQNIRNVLKPNGYVLLRDYAIGDLAQERLNCKDQRICENFYVRGDGTRAFYFSEDFLTSLFRRNGFNVVEVGVCCKQVENRSRELVMNRRWVQAVFSSDGIDSSTIQNPDTEVDLCDQKINEPKLSDGNTMTESGNGVEINLSESIALDMFGLSQYIDEIVEINLKDYSFRIKGVSKEFQHTCKSTGLMLWESAQVMSRALEENPTIVAGKKVLELGCGCAGICSMVAVRSADLVVATDGDMKALDLLRQNVALNLEPVFLEKLFTKRLEWGNEDHIKAIYELNHEGFDVIIGTDVVYVAEAISPLFETARLLISRPTMSSDGGIGCSRPALILCHVVRQVDEASIVLAASRSGFHLVDRWAIGAPANSLTSSCDGGIQSSIISSWFSSKRFEKIHLQQNTAISIMYFHF